MPKATEHEKVVRHARELASLLGEMERGPLRTIHNIIYHLGLYFAREMYIRAIEVQINGGMMLPDGSRKRTLGGVFFQVVRQELTEAERDFFLPDWRARKARLAADPVQAAAAAARREANIAKDQALKAAAAERKAARAAASAKRKVSQQEQPKPAQSVAATPAPAPLSEKMQAAKAKAAAALLEHQATATVPTLTPEQAAAALEQWRTATKRKQK